MVQKLINRIVYLPLLLLCMLSPAVSFAENRAENIQKSLEASIAVNWGSIVGFVQTPAGGRPGTSSKERPTLGVASFLLLFLSFIFRP